MQTMVLWKLPFNSVDIHRLLFYEYDGETIIALDYFNDDSEKYYSCAVMFDSSQAFRHSSEKFTHYINDSLDTLVEVEESDWVQELKVIDPVIADYWKLKHYAIYIKDYAQYEVVATGYKIIDISEGKIDEALPWIMKT